MSVDELIAALRKLAESDRDSEVTHSRADSLLISYIDDTRVTLAFDAIVKWYA